MYVRLLVFPGMLLCYCGSPPLPVYPAPSSITPLPRFVLRRHGDGRLEDVEAVLRRGHDEARYLRVEVDFFDVGLPLVDEQKLRRELGQRRVQRAGGGLVVGLDGQVPHGDLVVTAGDAQHGLVVRSPFDRRHRPFVVLEVREGTLAVADRAQIPHLQGGGKEGVRERERERVRERGKEEGKRGVKGGKSVFAP